MQRSKNSTFEKIFNEISKMDIGLVDRLRVLADLSRSTGPRWSWVW
jgi:hypothetical protein